VTIQAGEVHLAKILSRNKELLTFLANEKRQRDLAEGRPVDTEDGNLTVGAGAFFEKAVDASLGQLPTRQRYCPKAGDPHVTLGVNVLMTFLPNRPSLIAGELDEEDPEE
jgi:hypothetical protein